MKQSIWLISLGDLLTLMLCFFLAIISLSPPANPSITQGSWKNNNVSPPDGTKVADISKESKFRDWTLTLNDPVSASNELEKLQGHLAGVHELIIEGCAFSDWGGSSKLRSVALVSSVVQKILSLGVSYETIQARFHTECKDHSEIVVSGLYG